MIFNKLTVAVSLVAASAVTALEVYQPSAQWWWQTGDAAALSWDCSDRTYSQFTVVVTNENRQLLPDITPLIPIQNNDACSTNLTPQLNPGTGYVVHLSNIFNMTEFYASSEPFEVKAKGSPYPTATPSRAGVNPTGGSSSGDQSTPEETGNSSASLIKPFGLATAFIGLTAVLGL